MRVQIEKEIQEDVAPAGIEPKILEENEAVQIRLETLEKIQNEQAEVTLGFLKMQQEENQKKKEEYMRKQEEAQKE